MGHERIGYLPKTQKWTNIVDKIKVFNTDNDNISDIASNTTKNVRIRFKNIEQDGGVIAAFKYLVLLTYASKLSNPEKFLKTEGINLPHAFNIFDLTKSVQDFVAKSEKSKEYSTFAVQSMNDTISEWSRNQSVQQILSFDKTQNNFDIWQKAATGDGFCELSRTFFAKFTGRYLKYFLEREASSKIQSLSNRQLFIKKLEGHVAEISKHAFETAKIAQSFAAGWYNKNAIDKVPSDSSMKGFLSFAFEKLNSELLREEHGQ
jgi:hypothetical protein